MFRHVANGRWTIDLSICCETDQICKLFQSVDFTARQWIVVKTNKCYVLNRLQCISITLFVHRCAGVHTSKIQWWGSIACGVRLLITFMHANALHARVRACMRSWFRATCMSWFLCRDCFASRFLCRATDVCSYLALSRLLCVALCLRLAWSPPRFAAPLDPSEIVLDQEWQRQVRTALRPCLFCFRYENNNETDLFDDNRSEEVFSPARVFNTNNNKTEAVYIELSFLIWTRRALSSRSCARVRRAQ